jgi:hypothetical protein
MPLPPLSHHDILALVEPFTRRGHRVDLAASDRLTRRLVFKSQALEAGRLQQVLQLEQPLADRFRLTRNLTLDGGLQARIECTGAQPGVLLAQVEAVIPMGQFRVGPAYALAFSWRLEAAHGGGVQQVLTEAGARLDGVALAPTLAMRGVRGYPADIRVQTLDASEFDLPIDLLAVLGWGWARLERQGDGWASTLKVRGREPQRSRRAAADWQTTVAHLARTLAEPPARFHERLAAARWAVVLRHAMPLGVGAGLVAGSMAVPRLAIEQSSALRMLVFNAPPILLGIGFCLRELPRFELPRWPRRSRAAAWWRPRANNAA